MHKLMEGRGDGEPGVAAKVGKLAATIRAGEWCEQQSSLLRAYAFGILDPDGERHALAVAHTRECPACRAQVALWRGLATVLPPLPLALPPLVRSRPPRRRRAREAGVRRLRVLVRRLVPHGPGSGAPLAAKLAVAGVALTGAGGVYVAVHASSSSGASAESGRANRAASAASFTSPGNPLEYPPLLRQASPLRTSLGRAKAGSASPRAANLARLADRPRWGRPSAPRAPSAPGAGRTSAVAPASSSSEFSPERVSSQPPPASEPPAPPSSPAPGADDGEFGIEAAR
jgi:hypothetical protein